MLYHRRIQIDFNHCDAAGIVFYPRYLEMTNSIAENFFRDVVGHSYGRMMAEGTGTPTAGLQVTYRLPSRLDDMLDWRMEVTRLGRSSIGLAFEAQCGEEPRISATMTLVFVRSGLGPEPWPEAIRAKIEGFMAA